MQNLKITIMKMNYTSVCFFCGVIYPSNKSSSQYCCTSHNSLHYENGTRINHLILTPKGIYVDYADILLWIWTENADERFPHSWSQGYSEFRLIHKFAYDGPLPQGSELIVVGQYLIKKTETFSGLNGYCVKMIHDLTKYEKATCMIVKGTFDKELIA